jgi:two-component system alkaline phosphatase synthesis response regulator PhoP
MTTKNSIVVIEDEPAINDLIHFNLLKEGYQVFAARDGLEGLQLVKEKKPDLVILDIMMPKMNGHEVCSAIRADAELKAIPIIFLTAKSQDEDIVSGLNQGGDDYITKPFAPSVLMARTQAVLRRSKQADSMELDSGGVIKTAQLSMDLGKRKVTSMQGEVFDLTFSEYEILLLLVKRPGWVFSRSQIVDSIRGSNHAITDRSVDVQIVGLRKKLGVLGNLIETVRGVGYKYTEESRQN